ncbi:ABC transporter substrate-binding protein [Paenibacillus marchantiophytorum]|uniref:ABC transporter substrate-binding protein n=1 Tax=Paenibacillus marchantiophytorum TaxID=1619310 RepID=A0ABQ2BV16_9BACL|nr:extracellular solute-binding protein [Paenibacillus marchantiophytorum]GGI46433.1 ABC transporter substrate-binding protein [Paenibacillus marchantiophytorum]
MKRKIGTILAGVILATATLTGCSSSSGTKPEPSASAKTEGNQTAAPALLTPDTSKSVELVWYLVGDANKDTPKVMEEFNKMLKKDLNATVKLNFTTWNDWQTKYNLLLTAGEKIDMIFASSWAGYFKYAKQGAFMDLTALIPKYAPQVQKQVSAQDWSDATIGGKIYAIPNTNPEYTPNGILYREDWRKELNLPEIKDIASIEAYLDGIKKNKQGVIPINGNALNEVSTLFSAVNGYQTIGGDTQSVVVAKSYNSPRDIVAYPFTPEYEAWVKKMKEWADKGYWSKNTLSSKQEAGDLIKTGKGAVYWRNPPGAAGLITELQKNDPKLQLGYFPYTRMQGFAMPTMAISNGMAIPKSAANPERSLMVLEKIRTDAKYYNLITYGLEGYHYDLINDGKNIVTPSKTQDASKVQAYTIADWGWRNKPLMKAVAGGWDGLDKLNDEFSKMSKPDIFSPISMDYDSVKTEYAAVNQVIEQYGKPLMMGLVPNVDQAIKTYQEKLKAAGIDKVLDYVKKQAVAYYDEKGIK